MAGMKKAHPWVRLFHARGDCRAGRAYCDFFIGQVFMPNSV